MNTIVLIQYSTRGIKILKCSCIIRLVQYLRNRVCSHEFKYVYKDAKKTSQIFFNYYTPSTESNNFSANFLKDLKDFFLLNTFLLGYTL